MTEFLDYANFEKNYYFEEYISLIKTNTTDNIFQRHHILPRCLGGTNDSDNIVRLSLGDHQTAHLLLTLFCKGNDLYKVNNACFFFSTNQLTSDEYCQILINARKNMSEKMLGKTVVKDLNGNVLHVSTDDPRYITKELRGINTNKTVVKNKEGTYFQVALDKFNSSPDLVGVAKGTVTLKDKFGNNYRLKKNDPKILDDNLVGSAKGNIIIHNIHTGEIKGIFSKPLSLEEGWKFGSGRIGSQANTSKEIIKIDPDTDNIIDTFVSATAAANHHSLKNSSGINAVTKGRQKRCAGFKWIYVEELHKYPDISKKYKEYKEKEKICQ